MDLAAGTHVLVMGVGSETQLGHAALHRLLIPFRSHLERLPGPQRAFAPGAAGNTAPFGAPPWRRGTFWLCDIRMRNVAWRAG